jgi:RNA polymerase sigma-70 factor (ECF subfamily)
MKEVMTHKQEQDDYFQSLYSQFKKKVLNTALNMVQHLEDAEEIMQDVFVELYFNLDNFRGESSVSTWIYRITVNKSLDLIKKRKRKKRFGWLTGLFEEGTGKELHVITEPNHPGILLENQEEIKALWVLIDQLPDKQRTALVLAAMEQLSYEEISKVMETSVSSVESLIFRARQNLRKKTGTFEGKKLAGAQVNTSFAV